MTTWRNNMNFKKIAGLAVTTLALNMAILGDVNAASADVKCIRNASRSKISVNGAGLGAGLYRARAQSGAGVAWSKAFQRPVRGEVEFDFDSNPADVRAGATAIPRTFIVGNAVNGRIYLYNTVTRTYALRAAITESCTAK
jgi:hypothetical protein